MERVELKKKEFEAAYRAQAERTRLARVEHTKRDVIFIAALNEEHDVSFHSDLQLQDELDTYTNQIAQFVIE